jgi:hypothetical protein
MSITLFKVSGIPVRVTSQIRQAGGFFLILLTIII